MRGLRCLLWSVSFLVLTTSLGAQSRIYGDRFQQSGTTLDATLAAHTRPFSTQSTLPAACTVNDWMYTPGVGLNMGTLSVCVAANTWRTFTSGTNGTSTNATSLNGTPITSYTGILKLANGVLSPVQTTDVTSLFTGAGSYLRADGTLGTPASGGLTAPGSNGLLKYIGSNVTAVATGVDVVGLFGSGSCSGFLKSDLTCGTVTGGGTLTNLTIPATPPWLTASVTNPTTTPAITLSAAAVAANLVLAGPASGANAAMAARPLVATDIPALDAAKITSGTILSSRLPLPGAGAAGVIFTQACNAGQHINAIASTGVPSCSSDTGGTATVSSSTIATMPANSSAGTLFYATDATSGGNTTASSLWVAGLNGAAAPILSLGVLGALTWTGPDTLDVDSNVVMISGISQTISGNKTMTGQMDITTLRPVPGTYSGLPACNSTTEGILRPLRDANTGAWGAVVNSGGGTFHVLAYCDSINWTIAAQ